MSGTSKARDPGGNRRPWVLSMGRKPGDVSFKGLGCGATAVRLGRTRVKGVQAGALLCACKMAEVHLFLRATFSSFRLLAHPSTRLSPVLACLVMEAMGHAGGHARASFEVRERGERGERAHKFSLFKGACTCGTTCVDASEAIWRREDVTPSREPSHSDCSLLLEFLLLALGVLLVQSPPFLLDSPCHICVPPYWPQSGPLL